jgi:hypothetical protein
VGLFSSIPTKLVLHFSDFSTIFYGFYKIQQLTKHYLRCKSQTPESFRFLPSRSLLCISTLENKTPLAIRSSGAAGGGPASNPARACRSPAEEEQREGLGTTKDPFVAGEGGRWLGASLAGRRRVASATAASRPASPKAKHGG